MAANDYVFVTRWRVRAAVEEVSQILSDALQLPNWWPQVYLSVRETEPGTFALLTRGWLPYRLRWNLHRVESREPYGFTLHAWGDLEGTGVWTFEPDKSWTNITYEWRIRAAKPLLRYLSVVLKPIFRANHEWAMARGEESLAREIQRCKLFHEQRSAQPVI